MESSKNIGFLGADWWGSDARAMAAEFRRQGHLLVERHYEDYLSTKWHGLGLRVARRLVLPLIKRQYNRAVAELLSVQALDFLLVFKGMLLDAETLKKFKNQGIPCYLVYPDVSFQDHGKNIWECLSLYDAVFTTKSYHLDDKVVRDRAKNLQLINHGYDPEVHRPIRPNARLLSTYGCDVSFVGCWSAKKEHLVCFIIDSLPGVHLKLWGPNWGHAQKRVREKWMGRGAYGDELAAVYSFSRINLGLLSEAGSGTKTGDRTTARSWQIPASGGFLLHEDTEEIRKYFVINEEIVVFKNASELALKIGNLLTDNGLREGMRIAGHKRCTSAPYTYGPAVNTVLQFHDDEAAANESR